MLTARIYKQGRKTTQSGRASQNKWVLEFEPGSPSLPEALMGWNHSSDTQKQVRIGFPDRKTVLEFAKRNGIQAVIHEPPSELPLRPKSYASNFARTRMRPWTH